MACADRDAYGGMYQSRRTKPIVVSLPCLLVALSDQTRLQAIDRSLQRR